MTDFDKAMLDQEAYAFAGYVLEKLLLAIDSFKREHPELVTMDLDRRHYWAVESGKALTRGLINLKLLLGSATE